MKRACFRGGGSRWLPASCVRLLAALAALGAAWSGLGCEPDLTLPADAYVRCTTDSPCPAGFVCRAELGRCVRADGADAEAPTVLPGSLWIEPRLLRLDTPLLVRFAASEALGAAPSVRVSLPGQGDVELVASHETGPADSPTYHFVYAPTGGEPQGSWAQLNAQLVDMAGNVARDLPLAEVAFDFRAPSAVAIEALGATGQRPGATARVLLEVDEELAQPPEARVTPGGGALSCEPTWQERGYACSYAVPSAAVEGPVSLLFRLTDAAGNVGEVTAPDLLWVDATAPRAPTLDAQSWLTLLHSPTGWELSRGAPYAELQLCPRPTLPFGDRDDGGDGPPTPSGDEWSWCPQGPRDAAVFEPGAALLVFDAAWVNGTLRCGGELLARATLVAEEGLALQLEPPPAQACVALEDEAGNRTTAHPVEQLELVLTPSATAEPDTAQLRVQGRSFFEWRLDPPSGGGEPLSAAALRLPDGQNAATEGTGRWIQHLADQPAPRYGHALAHDAARGRTVLFGGQDPQRYGDTWEWDGSSWHAAPTAGAGGAPAARAHAALVWDPDRKRALLFGGEGDAGLLGDTWEWDGQRWWSHPGQPGQPGQGPEPRRRHAMVHEGPGLGVLLFGGEDARGEPLADMWRWDGQRWQVVEPRGGPGDSWPSPRSEHALARHAGSGDVVLYGGWGQAQGGGELADTWLWRDGFWRQEVPEPPEAPGPRAGHTLVYVEETDRVLLLGGAAGPDADATAWSWSGQRWEDRRPGPGELPAARRWHGAAHDPVRGKTLLFGGAGPSALGDTWESDGERWEQIDAGERRHTLRPDARSFAGLATDELRGRAVLFGGHAWSGLAPVWLGDTWEWDGWAWRVAAVAGAGPVPRSGHAMAGIGQQGLVALFGGYGGELGEPGARLGDLWMWDGAEWHEVPLPAGAGGAPAARNWHGLAYAAGWHRLVLFGGWSGSALGDTWEWDGGQWREQTTDDESSAPEARDAHAMAYDPLREQVIVFGGRRSDVGALDDTWAWDGVSWSERTPEGPSPEARASATLTWEASSGTLLLFGGADADGTIYDDAWAWDGHAWRQRRGAGDPVLEPTARLGHTAAPLSGGTGVLVFGGHAQQIDRRFADTWTWRPAAVTVPAQVVRASLGATLGQGPVTWQHIGLRVLAEGADGPAAAPLLYVWEEDGWRAAAPREPAPHEPPGWGAQSTFVSSDPDRNRGLPVGEDPEIAFALVPDAPAGAGDPALSTDYVELRVRVRLAPGGP